MRKMRLEDKSFHVIRRGWCFQRWEEQWINLQCFSASLLLIFRSGRSRSHRDNRINTDLSLLTFFSTMGSQKNTAKQHQSALLSSIKTLTTGSKSTRALNQIDKSMLHTIWIQMPRSYWQSALVKLTHPSIFAGHCTVRPTKLSASQKRAARSTQRNANMTIKHTWQRAENPRKIQYTKLWAPCKPKAALQSTSYTTIGLLQQAKGDTGQTTGHQGSVGMSSSRGDSRGEKEKTVLLISLDCLASPLFPYPRSFSFQLSTCLTPEHWSTLWWGAALQFLEIFPITFYNLYTNFSWNETE